MLDTINKERYTVLAQKWVKITAPNQSTTGSLNVSSGINDASSADIKLSRATKIVKMWIPGKRFTKSGIITYENGTEQVKFFDYHVLVYAYSNYSTLQDLHEVGRINDYIQTLYYKDS